jgi:aminomethyltransferase
MKRTALYLKHVASKARIVEFAGYEMPVEYSGVNDEHMAVRNGVGIFDVSHMGEIWVKGPDAMQFLQTVTSNDVSVLTPGKVQYSCLPNDRGGIVDDLLVYCYEPEKYLLVVNASNTLKAWVWLHNHVVGRVNLENATDAISQVAVQGPKAINVLQKLTEINLADLKNYTFKTGKLAGIDDVIISATGYTGAGGFELYFYNEAAEKIWDAIMEAGKEFNIKPCGLAARDTLRLEMGYCLYGHEINGDTSPLEAGLDWITKLTDKKPLFNKEYLLKQKQEGLTMQLVGFSMLDKAIPRQHYEIVDHEGVRIGEVTSGTMSPILKKGIGMGYVKPDFTPEGTKIFVQIRGKNVPAEIVKTPFI